jgi:hypothetical protein
VKLRSIFAVVVAAMLQAESGNPQTKYPPETRNAALRYWLAFADLQDPPADKATQDLLEKVAAGDAAWDEAKLGCILEKNEGAILAMQHATKLPNCDWGLDYGAGPRASIAYAPRARVLARLNTLYGTRMAARGQTQRAVDTWLAFVFPRTSRKEADSSSRSSPNRVFSPICMRSRMRRSRGRSAERNARR